MATGSIPVVWTPDMPSPEEVEAMFPRDVFDGAVESLKRALWSTFQRSASTASQP